jgi:hypothetical protein
MFEFLLSPGGVVGALLGLGAASLIHWLFPALGDTATLFYAGLVAAGFLIGLVLDDKTTFRR